VTGELGKIGIFGKSGRFCYVTLLLSPVPEMDPDWLNDLIAYREQHGAMESTSIS
jgi:hypothetical protein